MTAEWTGDERREYCKLCKTATEKSIKSVCGKSSMAIRISLGLLVVCFVLSGIAWSAKSDVSHQKEMIKDIHQDQKKIKEDISKVAEFIDLLKDGKIRIPSTN